MDGETEGLGLPKAEQRRSEIVRILLERGSAPIRELADELGVSQMTIHRDLNTLQDQGLVRRIRGAVTAEKTLLFESSYLFRRRRQIAEKRSLARAAVAYVEPGNAVLWDDSTTTYFVTEFIDQITPVTVITNALPVMERLQGVSDVDLIALGGRYNRSYGGFFGLACERAIRSFHVDVALMSTTTIEGLSIYTQDEQVVRAKRAMIDVSKRKILLVDSKKFQYSALNYVADLTEFDVVLMAGSVDEAILARMHGAGVKVVRVETDQSQDDKATPGSGE